MSHVALEAEVQACAERPRTPAAREFEQVFHAWPQAEAQAPGRVHLLGEHAGCNDGLALAVAIPQQTRVAMRPNGRPQFRLHVAERGTTVEFVLQQPPAGHFASYLYGCLRLAQEEGAEIPPLDIHVGSDVPAGAGLSASAALEVATLRCLRALLSLPLDDLRIAQLAQQAGMQYAGMRCGMVDPMASSLGGTGTALLLDTRSLEHRAVPLPEGSAVLVLDSGLPRSAAASGSIQRRAECEEAARRLGLASLREIGSPDAIEELPDDVHRRRARHVFTENVRARQAAVCRDAPAFGELMNASHESLREDYEVSTPELDWLVQRLQQQPGVHGARLTGPGFGGACVALCESGAVQQAARAVLRDYAAAGHRGHLLVPAAQ
ncbi:galactokinase [Ramlibacter sp.]|uniref:galactokinase n=1 Tax=Ramlibacter sp. TaxID=1917967 RepID=UPI002D6E7E90|nr:galactokinase family protein [Ramlibacter sp.]HYD75235.1 galactokinase family protein [Ramlibacter sp.]